MKRMSIPSLYFTSNPLGIYVMDDFGNCVRMNVQTNFTVNEILSNLSNDFRQPIVLI